MKTKAINIFLVDENSNIVAKLTRFLKHRFGTIIKISNYSSELEAIAQIDNETQIIIITYAINDSEKIKLFVTVKEINPNTKVIFFSNNEDIESVINSMSLGKNGYKLNRKNPWNKMTILINKIINYPVIRIVEIFGISQYLAMFLITFITMAIAVLIAVYCTNIFFL
jgi:DNA-binding NarL/FixJ family response regulator